MTNPHHHYRVVAVPHEPGTFLVTGRTVSCRGECQFSYKHDGDGEPKHVDGSECPKCGQPLKLEEYLVDLNFYQGLGKCGCLRWQMHLQPLITRLSVPERLVARETDALRCRHGAAALRYFALTKLDERRATQVPGHADQEGVP